MHFMQCITSRIASLQLVKQMFETSQPTAVTRWAEKTMKEEHYTHV